MAEEARFVVSLDDQMSGAASDAAQSLQQLKSSVASNTAELAEMNNAMRALKMDAKASGDEIAALQAKISAKKSTIAEATRKLIQMGASFAKGGTEAKQAAAKIETFEGHVRAAIEPLQKKIGVLKSFVSWMDNLGLAKIIALSIAGSLVVLAVAFVAVGGVIGIVIAKMAKFALASSDAVRDQLLLLQGIAGTSIAAKDLQKSLSVVSSRVAISGDKLFNLGRKLAEAGLGGDQFRKALEAAAIASSAGGAEAEQAFMKAATAAAKAGKPIDKLAADVKGKFGAIAKAQMLGLRVQMSKLKENVTALFSGINIEPFLKGLEQITSLFDQNTVTGRALKELITDLLDPLFEQTESIGPVVRAFFQGLVIAVLEFEIGVLKLRNALLDAFGDDIKADIDWIKTATVAGQLACAAIAVSVFTCAAGFGLLVVLLGLAAVSAFTLMLPFYLLVAVVVAAIAGIYYAIKALIESFTSFGGDLMAGLSAGIQARIPEVIATIATLASNVKAAFASALKIGSPSKVFAEFGVNTTEGFSQGIEQGTEDVSKSVQHMVSLPEPFDPNRSSSASSQNPTHISITINAPSTQADDIASSVERVLTDLFEGAAMQLGAPLVEEA